MDVGVVPQEDRPAAGSAGEAKPGAARGAAVGAGAAKWSRPSRHSIAVAIAGSGGSGVMTAGSLLLDAAAHAGRYGLMVRTSGPQIRGGEAAALLRLASHPVASIDDAFDVLLALDWQNVGRFADEIPLRSTSLVIGDAGEGEAPSVFAESGAALASLPMRETAKAIPGSWPNMLALGLAGTLAGLPLESLIHAARRGWTRDVQALEANLAALRVGAASARELCDDPDEMLPSPPAGARWLLSGNEATGYGALRGGIRFVAAYPITPATELLEWMAPMLTRVGGTLLQAEDELASINMIIGASYGGVPALTATAGPGLALMTEALGLAVAAEVPVVVVDVMRGGPSTGIPAKSEQSDLAYAVAGLHGDAPRLVLASNSIGDCIPTTQWAVQLAESLQAPAIVLSDQFLGQSRAIVDRVPDPAFAGGRVIAPADDPDYRRYRVTPSGVSPMAIPGTRGVTYTADGLAHNERGTPSSQARDHAAQLDKRARKLDNHDYGPWWAELEGSGDLALITFGSATAPAREALARAAARGVKVRLVALRLLAPLLPARLAEALAGVRSALVVELNHGAQLYRYLRSAFDFPCPVRSFHRPGPLPFRPGELTDAILEWSRS